VHLHSYAYDGSGLARRLVTLDRDGQLASYDVVSGDPVAATFGATGSGTAYLSVTGDLVLVHSSVDGSVAAYDVETLALRWHIDMAFDSVDIASCGPVLCRNPGNTVPRAIDPATGEPVWSASVDWFSGGSFAYQPGPPWPAGFLLMDSWVVDARTGEPVIDLGEWIPAHSGRGPLSGVGSTDVFLVRYELGSGPANGLTWFARLHFDPPHIEVLGSVPSDSSGCLTDARLVVCPDRGELHIWRTRPADDQ
jgi:hypothetical protein